MSFIFSLASRFCGCSLLKRARRELLALPVLTRLGDSVYPHRMRQVRSAAPRPDKRCVSSSVVLASASQHNIMWTFRQANGVLSHDGAEAGAGYSGAGEGKNNPALQSVHNVGPIPCGLYVINEPHDTAKHGPYAMSLTPDPKNQMFGRYAFLIHGDSLAEPGSASQGCLIFARPIREQIWASGDHRLTVTA